MKFVCSKYFREVLIQQCDLYELTGLTEARGCVWVPVYSKLPQVSDVCSPPHPAHDCRQTENTASGFKYDYYFHIYSICILSFFSCLGPRDKHEIFLWMFCCISWLYNISNTSKFSSTSEKSQAEDLMVIWNQLEIRGCFNYLSYKQHIWCDFKAKMLFFCMCVCFFL